MTPRLLCRTGEFAGITRDIGADATLGRGSDNDIVVKSPMVSTSHARIYREEEDFFLEDLGSANGTRLDGMEVRGRMRLERLHVITLAETIDLIFTLSDSAPRAADRDRPTAATRAPTSSGDEPAPPGRKTEMADASAWSDLPDLKSPAASREPPESEPSKPQPPSAEPPGRKTEMADSSGWSDLPDLDAPAAKREPPKPDSGEGEPPPGRKTEMADSSEWADLPDLDSPPSKREPSKQEPSKQEPSGAEPPPGRKTEMADTSGWSDLPDLDAPASKPESSEPARSEPERSEAEPPPGRKTEMADSSAWAEVPDLEPVEEPEEEAEDEVPFEHRATVIEESVQLPPEDPGGDLGATVEVHQPGPEPTPLPELAVALPGRPLKTYALKEGDNVIGRSDDCDITIIDPEKQVSRNHAVLRVSRDGITLIDSGSANGTFIDGERVDQAQLSAGKSFRLGPNLECTLLMR